MSIAGQAFFEQKCRQFKLSQNHTGFMADFVTAVNNTLAQYAVAMDLADTPAPIADPDDNIDMDANRGFVLSMGVDYWLVRFGHKHGELDFAKAEQDWETALAQARQDRDRAATAAATDGEIIGNLDD